MTKKAVGAIFFAIGLVCLAWFAASWVDVILHNNSGGTQSAWNVFRVMFGG